MIKNFGQYTIRSSADEQGFQPYKATGFATGAIDDNQNHFTVMFDTDTGTRRADTRYFELVDYRGDNEGFDNDCSNWTKYIKLTKVNTRDSRAVGYDHFPHVSIKGTVDGYLTKHPHVTHVSINTDTNGFNSTDWNILRERSLSAFLAVKKAVSFYLQHLSSLIFG